MEFNRRTALAISTVGAAAAGLSTLGVSAAGEDYAGTDSRERDLVEVKISSQRLVPGSQIFIG